PTWAEVNLKALHYNINELRKIVGKTVAVMVVVKGNAYGHGLIEVSRALRDARVDYLGVATVDEAIRLREKKVNIPVLILGSVLAEEAEEAAKRDITLTLCNEELLSIIRDIAKRRKIKIKVHIKVDTGMGRIGVWHEEAVDFIKRVHAEKSIIVEGVYTHFSSAGRDNFFTQYQMDSFNNLIHELESKDISIKYKHAANSIATVDLSSSYLNLVRPGIIVFGIYPKRNFERLIDLKPALSLKTKIVFLKDTPPGRSISYGRTYITQRHTKIATLPIGYADGYGRILSNKAEVLIRGQRAPVVGKVTMDQTMVDVGRVRGVKVGDEVVLIGKQGDQVIRTEKLARLAGTIPYEVLCSISNRVPRSYKK
ncbi:MAG: alanine racemase, partial [Candidatus Omnitrophota bacterium]